MREGRDGPAGASVSPKEAPTSPASAGARAAGSLDDVLERLAADLYAGTETLATELSVSHDVLLRDLVDRARRSPPAILAPEKRRWGGFDVVVGVALVFLLVLAARAVWILCSPEPPPPDESPVESSLAGGPVTLGTADLDGRTVLALPIEPAGYALLGNLPTRLAAAVVPGPPAEGAVARPVLRLDDLLVLRAESADRGVAVVVAVPDGDLAALLDALPGATVHLLRPPPADESATPRKEPASATP